MAPAARCAAAGVLRRRSAPPRALSRDVSRRRILALKAFSHTATYDTGIAEYLQVRQRTLCGAAACRRVAAAAAPTTTAMPTAVGASACTGRAPHRLRWSHQAQVRLQPAAAPRVSPRPAQPAGPGPDAVRRALWRARLHQPGIHTGAPTWDWQLAPHCFHVHACSARPLFEPRRLGSSTPSTHGSSCVSSQPPPGCQRPPPSSM